MLISRDINELKLLREQILSGDWLRMSLAHRVGLIERFCAGYVVPPLMARMPTTYRARQNESEALFTNVSMLLAPPAELVQSAGRMNKAGEPTLYLGATAVSAMFETRPRLGAIVTILACRTRPDAEPFQIAPVAMNRARSTRMLGPINSISSDGPLGYPPFREALESRGLLEQWLLQDQTLGDVLTLDMSPEDQPALYDLTNGIRDHLYREYSEYEGVSYPSIVTGLTSLNSTIDEPRWKDIEPLEVWVAEAELTVAEHPEGLTILHAKPLIKFGSVELGGEIVYRNTSKSLLSCVNDFKIKHGNLRTEGYLKSHFVKPFMGYRISYGSDANKTVYDFHLS